MLPTLKFVAGRGKPISQMKNLEKWWDSNDRKVFNALNYYVKCTWSVKSIKVKVERSSRKGSKTPPYKCEGYVEIKRPDQIFLTVGSRVRWTKGSLCVFLHELIHCATLPRKDRRFSDPGTLEAWVLDELATDLLAQYVLKDVSKARPNIGNSIEYALIETADEVARDAELRTELVKKIRRVLKDYLVTEKSNFYSFRRDLKDV